MGQSEYLDSSVDFGAGAETSPDSEATLDQLIPAGLQVLSVADSRSSTLTRRGSDPPPQLVVKVRVPPTTRTLTPRDSLGGSVTAQMAGHDGLGPGRLADAKSCRG